MRAATTLLSCLIVSCFVLSVQASAFNLPPATQEMNDGKGGKFLIYAYNGNSRLQHVDEAGDVWHSSKLLTEVPHATVYHCFGNNGLIWLLACHPADMASELCHARVHCFDFFGNDIFENQYLSLNIKGVPTLRLADASTLVVTTEQEEFHVNQDGILNIPASMLTPRSTTEVAVTPEPYTYATPLPYEEPELIPFQHVHDGQTLEVSTFLQAGEVREVEIALTTQSGHTTYHFTGFVGEDYLSWLIPIYELPKGTYYLSMRKGEREQVEEIVLGAH
jgi:hypothetical protein